jgi:uncharacterized protein with PIN domain
MSSQKLETKLLADAMLGSLARKLRAFGFDTSYFKQGEDSDLIDLARGECRTILTADRALAEIARVRGVAALLITGSTDAERISALKRAASAEGVALYKSGPRCSVCNGSLQKLRRNDIEGKIPSSVEKRHVLFYRCTECGKYYWRGRHWKKLRLLERRLG